MRHSIPRNSCLFWDHLLILSQFRNSFAEACAKAFARVTTLHYCNKTESAVSVTLMCSMSCGGGGSSGAMVLGKRPIPGRPTNLDYSRARGYCACSWCGWGYLDIFFSLHHFSFVSPSLWETARYRLKYCPKGLLSQSLSQPTNPCLGGIFRQNLFYLHRS